MYRDMYAMYLRKSRADLELEAKGELETLVRHEHTLTELARKNGYPIGHIYKEIVSGETIDQRPEIQTMLSDIEQGKWKGILVMDVDRLARGDTMDQGRIARTFFITKTQIITPVKIYNPVNEFDTEYFEFELFMSRREYKAINRRIQNGRRTSVKEGKYIASVPPFGYKRVKIIGDKGFTLEIIPEQAQVVKMIFDWYVNGYYQDDTYIRFGSTRIAKKLNELKIPTISGKQWSPSSIRDILHNSVYTAKVKFGERKEEKNIQNGQIVKTRKKQQIGNYMLVNALHEAIIEPELFSKAAALMKSRIPSVKVDEKMKNPFCSILICGKCGRHMIRQGICSHNRFESLYCANISCNNVSSSLDLVETRIIDGLKDWIESYEIEFEQDYYAEESEIVSINKQLSLLEKEDEKFQTQEERIFQAFETGIYDADIFSSRMDSLKKQKETLELQLTDLKHRRTVLERQIQEKHLFIPKLKNVVDIYYTLDNARAKNELLLSVLEKIEYTRDKGGRWEPRDNFTLKLYPKLPGK